MCLATPADKHDARPAGHRRRARQPNVQTRVRGFFEEISGSQKASPACGKLIELVEQTKPACVRRAPAAGSYSRPVPVLRGSLGRDPGGRFLGAIVNRRWSGEPVARLSD